MYTKLLKMCGWQDDELGSERSRIERTLQILEIGPRDVELAEERLPTQVDVSLEGVRKVLRIWWSELLNLVLAKEENKKIIYFTPPTVPTETMEAIAAAVKLAGKTDEVLLASPDLLIATVMGTLFDRNNPIVEIGEGLGLAAGVAHCGLSQTWLAGMAKGYIPVPDLSVSSAYMCDQVPEAQELIAELFPHDTVYVDKCYDQDWDLWPDTDPRTVAYLTSQFRKAFDKVEQVTGCPISDQAIKEGRRDYIQAFLPYSEVRDFMTYDPPPISVADIMPFFYMFLNTLYDKEPLVDACSTMAKEARERAQQGYGVVPKGAPRIIFPLVPNVDTGIVHTIENLGLAIPTLIMMYQTQQEKSHKKAATDPLTRIVEAYLGRPWYTHNFHPFKEWVKQMAEKFDADGILWFQTSVCRVNSAENPIALRKAITEEMGLPFVLLEGDYHCTRVYRPEDMETKIETFAEVVKARQAARQRQD